jgi:hypothetical protein
LKGWVVQEHVVVQEINAHEAVALTLSITIGRIKNYWGSLLILNPLMAISLMKIRSFLSNSLL